LIVGGAFTTELSRTQIDDLLLAGARLAEIEDLIAASGLPEDEQAAYWLRAWSVLERGPAHRPASGRTVSGLALRRPA
jgi:hypothetical protein